MEIRWVTAFIDRPADAFDAAVDFWRDLTGSALSSPRGEHDQFATLLPPDGDPYLRVQRIRDGGGGSHVDLHVDDVRVAVAEAERTGAELVSDNAGFTVMRSPGGLLFCLVAHHGENTVPSPRSDERGGAWLVDQLCIDAPANRYYDECRFWAVLTAWPLFHSPVRPEFGWFRPPTKMPVRVVIQRRNDSDAPSRAHLDLASTDRTALARVLEAKGAKAERLSHDWIVMKDTGGVEFCVTGRDPATGILDREECWHTDEDLATARARFASLIEGYRPPVAYSVARIDADAIETPVFAHINEPRGSHLLPGVVLAYVCGHAAGTATYELTGAQLRDAIWLLSPAEAAAHWDHPNLWSWRKLLKEGADASRYVAVFVGDIADSPVNPMDAEFRRLLPRDGS